MPRGSMPGERPGGRQRGTPNRRTNLCDRILAVASALPTASSKQLITALVKDQELPADTRIAVAQRFATPVRGKRRTQDRARIRPGTTGQADVSSLQLGALFGIVQCDTTPVEARRQAAYGIAKVLLPAKSGVKRSRSVPDEYGFTVHPDFAREYRDIDYELRALTKGPGQNIPATALKIAKLQARRGAIRARLRGACPLRYGKDPISKDMSRLDYFWSKRENGIPLTEEEDAEEAHLKARYDSFAEGPEQTARRRREELEGAELLFRKTRFFREENRPPAPSRRDRSDLRLLRWLYPPRYRVRQEPDVDHDEMMSRDHPFNLEKPDAEGLFYTFEEFVEVPPVVFSNPNYPPYRGLPPSKWPTTKADWEKLMRAMADQPGHEAVSAPPPQ